MPFSFEREHYRYVAREFFAWLPVKTVTGWAIWTDCVEVWTLDPHRGWEIHFEKLYKG